MMPKKGVFIGQRKDRMGARLLMMLTCIRLAEDFGTSYKVNWFPQGSDAPELDKPQELFAQDWMDARFLGTKEFDRLSKKALPIWNFQGDKTPDRLIAHLDAGRSVLVEEGFEVLAFPWEDIEAIRPRYKDFIHQIGFTDEIRAIMACADEKLSGQGVSAYHIRRGDILNGLPWKHTTWPAKIEPEELYEAHLEKAAGQTAIMFSDQPELITRFQKRFPNLLRMSDIAEVSDMTRAQRDFLELFSMSRAEQVVAPYISAFSMAAARISGRQRLVFKDVLAEDEISIANHRVVDRVAQGPAAFLNPSEAAHIYSKAAQYLSARDEIEIAYDLARPILEAGADNAFMPLLQAINCFYLSKWKECEKLSATGLDNKDLWSEDYAVLLALRAATLGAQKKRWSASRHLARAFWGKPLRPDVAVLASRMLYRDQISARLFPPTNWQVQRQLRRRRFPPFNNLYLVQHKVLVRQPCNFDFVLMDWSDLALDQKARRILDDRARLERLAEGFDNLEGVNADDPGILSGRALLDWHLGATNLPQAIDETRKITSGWPENPLYHKRLSSLYEADGDLARARMTLAEALACDPGNPFLVFAMGKFLERNDAVDQGQNQIIQAADLDDNSAVIQGEAGQIQLRRGNKGKARPYLQKAHDLFPPFKRFANQLARTR
jgi:Flp pilus assembly protein TadD